jgi:hypothetical protein
VVCQIFVGDISTLGNIIAISGHFVLNMKFMAVKQLSALLQTIAVIGAVAYFLDRDGSFRNSFSDGWDRFLSKHPIPFYYCIGMQIFCFLMHSLGAPVLFMYA